MDGTQLMYLIGWILAYGIPGMIHGSYGEKENEKTAKTRNGRVAIFAIVAAAMLTTPVYYDFRY